MIIPKFRKFALPLKTNLFFLFFLFICCPRAHSEYWGGKNPNVVDSDMLMQDVKIPCFAETTYNAFWHTWLTSKTSKKSVFFYGGTTYNDHGESDTFHKTGMVWSFWHQPAIPLWVKPGLFTSNNVGEGALAKLGGNLRIKDKNWYRHVMKVWEPLDVEKAKQFTYMGWWMKDLEGSKEWQLLGLVQVPIPDAFFSGTGLGGFIEDFGYGNRKIRGQTLRNLFAHSKNKWYSIAFRATEKAKEYHKVTHDKKEKSVTFEISANPFEGARLGKKHKLIDLNEKAHPPIAKLKIKSLTAQMAQTGVIIHWSLEKSSTPQLQATIAILANDKSVLATHHVELPSIHEVYLNISSKHLSHAKKVSVTITDIFGQKKTKIIFLKEFAGAPQKSSGKKDEDLESGVEVSFYEKENALKERPGNKSYANWKELPPVKDLKFVLKSHQAVPSLDLLPREFGIVAQSKSYLKISKLGLYRFHLTASHGGQMTIADQVIIKQNIHASKNSKSGWMLLEKGYHLVTLDAYCDANETNVPQLRLEYEGPEVSRREVPADKWFTTRSKKNHVALELSAQTGEKENGNIVTFTFHKFSDPLNTIERIELCSERNETWATIKPSKNPEEKLTVFLPEGTHRFTPRIFYKDDSVRHLTPLEVKVKNSPSAPWTLKKPREKTQRPFGYKVTPDSVLLTGDGERWVHQKVKGDFTFTMRVKEFTNAIGGESRTPNAIFGLIVRPEKKNAGGFKWWYDSYFRGRFATPLKDNHGLKQKSWGESGHDFTLPCYARFSRKGNHFTLQIREEKKSKWTTLFEETTQLPSDLLIGPYIFQTVSPNPNMFYYAQFDKIKIKQQ